MSRKTCKRRIRVAVAPAMATLHCDPRTELIWHTAIEALKGGYATAAHYRQLADCQSLLSLACREKPDASASAAADMGFIAMSNIFQRQHETGRWGASGEELNALRVMVDFSQDYWRRQSGLRMNRCINKLKIVREKQFAELEKKAA